MPRGDDTRFHLSRQPKRPFKGYRHVDPSENIGNVVWVNFEDPTKNHSRVDQYVTRVMDEIREKKNNADQ